MNNLKLLHRIRIRSSVVDLIFTYVLVVTLNCLGIWGLYQSQSYTALVAVELMALITPVILSIWTLKNFVSVSGNWRIGSNGICYIHPEIGTVFIKWDQITRINIMNSKIIIASNFKRICLPKNKIRNRKLYDYLFNILLLHEDINPNQKYLIKKLLPFVSVCSISERYPFIKRFSSNYF